MLLVRATEKAERSSASPDSRANPSARGAWPRHSRPIRATAGSSMASAGRKRFVSDGKKLLQSDVEVTSMALTSKYTFMLKPTML